MRFRRPAATRLGFGKAVPTATADALTALFGVAIAQRILFSLMRFHAGARAWSRSRYCAILKILGFAVWLPSGTCPRITRSASAVRHPKERFVKESRGRYRVVFARPYQQTTPSLA